MTAMSAISRLAAFARSQDGRPARLGFIGAVLIALGGLGAGSTRQHDPLLETMHLSWLRFGHGLVTSSLVLWTGVALMVFAWLWLAEVLSLRAAIGGAVVVGAVLLSEWSRPLRLRLWPGRPPT